MSYPVSAKGWRAVLASGVTGGRCERARVLIWSLSAHVFLSPAAFCQHCYQRVSCPLTSALPLSHLIVTLSLLAQNPPLQQTEGWEEREVLPRTEEREKSWSVRLQLLTSNSQKFSGICKRQWWLKVVSVRSSSLSLSVSVCVCVSVMACCVINTGSAGFSICHSL